MPKKRLTDAFVATASAKDGRLIEYIDEKEPGLCLRVTANNSRSWTYRYRTVDKKQRRLSLGKVRDVSLADARKLVVKYRAQVAEGLDPVAEVVKAQELTKQRLDKETVIDIGNWYFERASAGQHKPNLKRPKKQDTIDRERYYFDRCIVPSLGKRKLKDLRRASIQIFLGQQKAPSTARHCRALLQAIFAFAERHDIVTGNPCKLTTVPSYEARERVLTNEEVKVVWQTLTSPSDISTFRISPGVALAIQILLTTLQRRGEVSGMRVDEVDLEQRIWHLPSSRTKNYRPHIVPLSNLTIDLIVKAISIRSRESEFIFPSPRIVDGRPDKPIEANALTRAFNRMKDVLNLDDVRVHDLRRTGATNMTSEVLGIPRFVVSKVLNHTSDTGNSAAVTNIYDKNDYLVDKRKALNVWAERLLEIATSE